jgi:antitoxin component YwqK of YwqJK toxin-antitoxin module
MAFSLSRKLSGYELPAISKWRNVSGNYSTTINFMTRKLIIFISIFIYGCQGADIDDADKRNENWMYWTDKKTGESSWIPVGDKTTVKDGSFTSFYNNGNVFQKGKLKNAKRIDTIFNYDLNNKLIEYEIVKPDTLLHYYINEGPFISYLQNEKILEKGIVKNHKIGDEWTTYFKNGKIKWTQKLKDGTGFIRWYYDNGQTSIINYKVKGKANGQVKSWFEDGKIKLISNWKDDLQNGDCETYHENGKLKDKSNWLNDKLNGKRECWYDNGIKEQIEFYNNGVRDGQIIQWYSNGNKKATIKFINGETNGKAITYYENGEIKVEGNFNSGTKEGLFSYYEENGKIIRKQTFHNGELLSDD